MSEGHFASSTSVTRAPTDDTEGRTRFDAQIVDGWDILGNANGGYLMSLLGRAALTYTERPDVVSMSANFLAPGRAGPIVIDVEEVRLGRRFATVQSTATSVDAARATITSTVICGDLTEHDGPTLVSVTPPEIPEPDDCITVDPTETFPPPFVGNFDQRIHPDDTGGLHGEPAPHGLPQFRSWMRLRDGEPMDSLAVVLFGDALPPPVFNSNLPVGWSPTVQLTVHVHARPANDWVLVDHRADIIDGGVFEAVTTVFERSGKVLGRARQLQLIALP